MTPKQWAMRVKPRKDVRLPRKSIEEVIAAAVAEERAATVKWLLEAEGDGFSMTEHAEWIEIGDHRKD